MYKPLLGEEMVFFNFSSALGKEMEVAFSEVFEYMAAIDYRGIDETEYVKHRYTLVHNHCKSVLFPALSKIIEKHTNIKVLKWIDTKFFCGMFAVDISLDNFKDVEIILNRQTGESSGDITVTDSAKEVADLSKNLNRTTGKLTSNKFGKDKQRPVTCKFYIDVDMAFLMNDNLPKEHLLGHIGGQLTPAELTATYLHEIGHVVTMIDQADNAFQQFEQVKQHFKKLRKNQAVDVPKVLQVYKNELRPQMQALVNEKKVSEKILKFSDAVMTGMEYSERTYKSDYFGGTFELLCKFIINSYLFLGMMFFRIFYYAFCYGLFRGLFWLFGDHPGDYGKVTDQSTSMSVFYHAERMADEYVVRQGYGADLASGLEKLTKAISYAGMTVGVGVHSGSLRDSMVFSNMLGVCTVLFEFFRIDAASMGNDFFGPNNYEDDFNRLHRILVDTQKAFKNNMPREVSNEWLGKLDKIKRAMDRIKKPFIVRVSDLIWKYVEDYPMVIKRMTQNDDMEEMEEMLRKLDEIINNELYATAERFKLLAD